MVHISFNTEELTITETQALVNLLTELADGRVELPEAEVAEASADTSAPIDLSAPGAIEGIRAEHKAKRISEPAPTTNYREETGKAKRGRPKKEEATPATFPEPDPIPEPVIAQAVEKLTDAIDADAIITVVPTPTLDELRAALQAFAVKHGMAEGTTLLQNYGVARVSEIMNLEAMKQHRFVVDCNA